LSFAATFAPVNWAQTVTPVAPLAFGRFTAGAGTVSVDAAGQRSATGGVKLLSGASVAAATFTLDGDNRGKAKNSKSYQLKSISCGAGLTGPGKTVPIGVFNSVPPSFAQGAVIDFPKGKNPTATVMIGATVTVAANQASGFYSCPLDLIVDFYN
jgi:hypothetical protein